MIFNLKLNNNQNLPMFIHPDELLKYEIIQHDALVDYKGYDDVIRIYFVDYKTNERVDLRKIEFDIEALSDYVFRKTGQEVHSFSFPEVGSYEYMLAAMGQRQTSPNLYIKFVEIDFDRSLGEYDYHEDPYADDPSEYDRSEYYDE